MKLYVPNYQTNNCVVVRDQNTIRVYDSNPTINSDINYVDYYINSDYISINGVAHFNQYSSLPSCLSADNITTSVYYRVDFYKILIMFFLLLLICFYFPYRIISRAFGRWLKW